MVDDVLQYFIEQFEFFLLTLLNTKYLRKVIGKYKFAFFFFFAIFTDLKGRVTLDSSPHAGLLQAQAKS